MIKTLLTGIAVALMFVIPQGFAEEQDDGPEMLGFYHFYAPDPAAVVAAMDKFWASDCGKEYPAEVALSAEVFNGGYPSSHFVLNTYKARTKRMRRLTAERLKFEREGHGISLIL